jgi:hypothetical protein
MTRKHRYNDTGSRNGLALRRKVGSENSRCDTAGFGDLNLNPMAAARV